VKNLKLCLRNERERSERISHKGRFFSYFAKTSVSLGSMLLGMWIVPEPTFAAGLLEAAPIQVKAGTLPLLAALGIGIAVAVGAVIAFLQLTAKGKEKSDIPPLSQYDNEWLEGMENEGWDAEASTTNSELEDHSVADYTIPLTRLITYADEVETADESEPRICGVEGEHSGSCYRILNRRLSFGRDPELCSILFPYEAVQISRLHCTVSYIEESQSFMLEDHGSSNGTFLADGQRLKPSQGYELRSGQRFSLSGNEHWFEVKNGMISG
jgi:hypothetical protein